MIVGSGIAGCYLGKLTGMEIWEKNKAVIEKPCSSLLSKTGLDSLDIDYSEIILNEVKGARFFSKNQEFSVEKKRTQAYVLDRLGLQKEMVAEAKDGGCRIKYGKAWHGQEDDYVLGADGALSGVARSMGIQRRYIHTYQIKAEMARRIDPDFVELHFGDFAPGFFGWMVPVSNRRAEIGIGAAAGNVKTHFDRFVNGFGVKRIEKVQSALIPVFDPRQKTVLGNKALVGDAAGQVKATTGGGIIFGCKCAEILAKAADKNNLGYYEKRWRKEYGRDLKLHLMLRRFLDRTDYDALFSLVKSKGVDELIARHGDMDHPGKLLKHLIRRPSLLVHLPKFFFESL